MTRSSHRFRNLLSNALGSLMEPAEDPRRSAPDAGADPYQRQRLLLTQVQQALQDLETTRGHFMQQSATAKGQAADLKAQAGHALNACKEDMARSALRRRAIVTAEIASLDQHIAEIQTEEERLSLLEQNLRSQIETLHARQQIAAARQTAAGAQVRIGEALYGVSDELLDVALELDRREQDANVLQARANAIADLAASGSLILSDPLQRGSMDKMIARPATPDDIESQLELLRQELSNGNDPHADVPNTPQD